MLWVEPVATSKAFWLSHSPHQREFCMLGQHALGMLGRTLETIQGTHVLSIVNPQPMREGYGSSVCVLLPCMLVATYLVILYTTKSIFQTDIFHIL